MRTKNGVGVSPTFYLLLASILLLTLAYPIAAQIPQLAGYYGGLKIDGIDAPAGTTIVAKIGDEVRGELKTDKPGEYGSLQEPLWVTGSMGENNVATVTFYADGQLCSPTAIWVSGNIERVDLTFAPTPTPTPTLPAAARGTATPLVTPTPTPVVTPIMSVVTPTPVVTPIMSVVTPTPTPAPSPWMIPLFWIIVVIAVVIIVSLAFISQIQRRRKE